MTTTEFEDAKPVADGQSSATVTDSQGRAIPRPEKSDSQIREPGSSGPAIIGSAFVLLIGLSVALLLAWALLLGFFAFPIAAFGWGGGIAAITVLVAIVWKLDLSPLSAVAGLVAGAVVGALLVIIDTL